MQHFPIFMAVAGRRINLSGGGAAALAKLRLLMKTEARISVFAADPDAQITAWADQGHLTLVPRALEPGDTLRSVLFYAANEDAPEDARVARIAQDEGALVNIVDNLADSQFITPAIVDRDPVVVAIGTEGAAPVLARAIKKDLEERLPVGLGVLARAGKAFRKALGALPAGVARRDFWAKFYFERGPKALAQGTEAVSEALQSLFEEALSQDAKPGHVDLVGAGPGDPELLTMKARSALDRADVVIHDRLVPVEILELARREAVIIEAGKTGFGPSTPQDTINALMVAHASKGAHVVRLKAGDPTVFGRLDEEIDALDGAGLSWSIVPGITAASAGVALIGQSLTKRQRNSAVRLITGHDTRGFAPQDWATLAKPGEVAAIYMGRASARFIQGRLTMHGAAPDTPITVLENITQTGQRIHATTLAGLSTTMRDVTGPALTLYGLAPRAALAAATDLPLQEIAQ